ncbi:MAG: alpha/beta hydrolase [Puniceicoccales bacterium]|jgi:acetyl esterase/lipase|nr:alpha/beta hydrolase [Puniceicoccales bacterium]
MKLAPVGLFIGLLLFPISLLGSPEGTVIQLWPMAAPGETISSLADDKTVEKGKPGDSHLTNIAVPTVEVFRPPADKNTGTAVLVCPGGGYGILAYDKEGIEIAQWLNTLGVTGVVLKYRVPARSGTSRGEVPLQDAQRALSYIRAHADEWKIDPKRIGMIGFSAGGHLVALTANTMQRTYTPIDDADKQDFRPNFTMLIYPAYLNGADGKLTSVAITEKTPSAFLAHAANDPVPVDSSLLYFSELRKNKVPAELHVYATGGHGYGMRPPNQPSLTWPSCAAEWLRAGGWLKEKK